MSPLATPDIAPILAGNRAAKDRSKTKNILPWLFLAAVIILCVSGAMRMMSAQRPQEVLQVVAAGQDLPAGCRLGFTSLHYMQIPVRYKSPSMFTSFEQLAGRRTKLFIKKGEPIAADSLLAPNQEPAALLRPGTRAMTLTLEPDSLVDNLLAPGDRVDVIVTTSKDNKRFTRTVCQNLSVMVSSTKETLLSDHARVADSSRVTLAASPSDCERLSEAAALGKLRLVMRPQGDSELSTVSGATERDILPPQAFKDEAPIVTSTVRGLLAPPPPPASQAADLTLNPPPPPVPTVTPYEAARGWVVEMFSGAKKESCEIPVR